MSKILKITEFKGSVWPEHSTRKYSPQYLVGDMRASNNFRISPNGTIYARRGFSMIEEVGSPPHTNYINQAIGLDDRYWLGDYRGSYLYGYKGMGKRTGGMLVPARLYKWASITYLEGGRCAGWFPFPGIPGPRGLIIAAGALKNYESCIWVQTGFNGTFSIDLAEYFIYGSKTIRSITAANKNSRYSDLLVVSADSELLILYNWLPDRAVRLNYTHYAGSPQIGVSWKNWGTLLLFVGDGAKVTVAEVDIHAGDIHEVASEESHGYYVVTSSHSVSDNTIYVWAVNVSGNEVEVFQYDKANQKLIKKASAHGFEIVPFDLVLHAFDNVLIIPNKDHHSAAVFTGSQILFFDLPYPNASDPSDVIYMKGKYYVLREHWERSDEIVSAGMESRYYDVLQIGDKTLFLSRGSKPQYYDEKEGVIKSLSVGPAPALTGYSFTSNTDFHGASIAVCIEHEDGRRTPWAVINIPPGETLYFRVVPYIHARDYITISPTPNPDGERTRFKYSIRVFVNGATSDWSTGGYFVEAYDPSHAIMGKYKDYNLEDAKPRTGLVAGYMGILPPQDEPPEAAFGAMHKGRLFLANTHEHPNRVWFSDLIISHFDLQNWWFDIDDEEVRGLLSLGDKLLIFGKHSLWALSGDPPVFGIRDGFRADIGTFTLGRIYDKGLAAPKAFTAVGDTVFFMTGRGIYVIQQGVIKELTTAMRQLFEDDAVSLEDSKLFIQDSKLFATFSYGGANKVLVYDIETNAFSIDNLEILSARVYETSQKKRKLFGLIREMPIVYWLYTGNEDDGSPVEYDVRTVDSNLGAPGVVKKFKKLYIDLAYDTFQTFNLAIIVDGETALSSYPVSENDIRNGISLGGITPGESIAIQLGNVKTGIEVLGFTLIYDEITVRPSAMYAGTK